ncbi:MAG: M42 family peptidase [Chloroflexi bacterium]|nr:MAG: M42 family peptidase [Chloroflexota bacterium]
MPDIKSLLKNLISLPGLSAYEEPVREAIAEAWKPLVDELTVSRMGSLHGLKRGVASEPRPKILLAAHMDAIGLMVTGISEGGLLRFYRVGGVDPRILPGMPVTVYGKRELPGIIVQPPDSLLPAAAKGKPVKMEYLLVDTGLEPEEVRAQVRVGDLISFATPPTDLSGDALSGHSLDNRASVAAVTACLDELQRVRHAWDVYAVATVQEEESLMGGFTSPYEIRPQIAVAVDVTHAKGPGASDWRTVPLGKGFALDWGPNTHPVLFEAFKELAERLDLPFSMEVYPSGSGTDAMGMQIVAEGIPTMVISIPLRYMHTPVELVSYKDIARTGHLLAQFIAGLEPVFLDKLTYENE